MEKAAPAGKNERGKAPRSPNRSYKVKKIILSTESGMHISTKPGNPGTVDPLIGKSVDQGI